VGSRSRARVAFEISRSACSAALSSNRGPDHDGRLAAGGIEQVAHGLPFGVRAALPVSPLPSRPAVTIRAARRGGSRGRAARGSVEPLRHRIARMRRGSVCAVEAALMK
jgi:hypothetical protein